jgi:uroporphyrinogen decarboxylase
MNSKENLLEAIYFRTPDHVPCENEDLLYRFSFEGIERRENWTDSWGIGWETEIEGMAPFPKKNPLESLEKLEGYMFPDPGKLELSDTNKQMLKTVDRSQKLIVGHMPYLLFERAWALMGMENFLISLIVNPVECHILLHGIAEYARKVFDRYLELGADGITFSEDLGSQRALMISPQLFREFLLPEYKYCFENAIKQKKIIDFHSCGCVDAIAEDLASISVTVLNPIQARANNLSKIKNAAKGHMALKGGIDTALIMTGTPTEVRNEVIRVLEILKPGCGYICAPDQHLPGMPEENMKMLWRTAKEFGKY